MAQELIKHRECCYLWVEVELTVVEKAFSGTKPAVKFVFYFSTFQCIMHHGL